MSNVGKYQEIQILTEKLSKGELTADEAVTLRNRLNHLTNGRWGELFVQEPGMHLRVPADSFTDAERLEFDQQLEEFLSGSVGNKPTSVRDELLNVCIVGGAPKDNSAEVVTLARLRDMFKDVVVVAPERCDGKITPPQFPTLIEQVKDIPFIDPSEWPRRPSDRSHMSNGEFRRLKERLAIPGEEVTMYDTEGPGILWTVTKPDLEVSMSAGEPKGRTKVDNPYELLHASARNIGVSSELPKLHPGPWRLVVIDDASPILEDKDAAIGLTRPYWPNFDEADHDGNVFLTNGIPRVLAGLLRTKTKKGPKRRYRTKYRIAALAAPINALWLIANPEDCDIIASDEFTQKMKGIKK